MAKKLEKPSLPGSTEAASKKMIGATNDPPRVGVFEENGKSYKYKLVDGEWIKKQVGKKGNFLGRERKQSKDKKVQLSFAVSLEFKSELEEYCSRSDDSVSKIVRKAVKEFIINHPNPELL